jgi:hypothetical protein
VSYQKVAADVLAGAEESLRHTLDIGREKAARFEVPLAAIRRFWHR